MRRLAVIGLSVFSLALPVSSAHAIGVGAKMKAKKILADLVPAHAGTEATFLGTAARKSACEFDLGKSKMILGKDIQVQLKKVRCSGTPVADGTQFCAHTKILSTIVDEELASDGSSTAKTCISPSAANVAGKTNYVTGSIGTITCTSGTCKGVLPPVTADPCPDVDKVTEVRRLQVFDGDDSATAVVLGSTLGTCCGPGQTFIGGVAPGGGDCPNPQDVMAEMGQILHGVTP
jgi:hypothetical protein